ncbi:hypothetical protein GFV15_04070 [Lactococcus lactis]|uniref:hypothetical protein n=1 Tax=Lactococcus lactis TaxID=1358 RepID=UPI0012934832|nr:hypothetical protein [Lactococcus lactis]MQQ80144.1 hypothetical protein [Lactococcus lactis]
MKTKTLFIDEEVQGEKIGDLNTEQLIKQVVKNIDDDVISVEIKKRHRSDELLIVEKETKMEKILRGFNGASINPLLSEEEKEAFKKIIEVLSKTELSVIQINKVLYSVDTELYKVAMNKSLKHLKSNQ